VTSKGIYQKPEETLVRVRTALHERGAKGLPPEFSDAWRPHFPISRPVARSVSEWRLRSGRGSAGSRGRRGSPWCRRRRRARGG
jgi:hypothetical protein